jgi:hypothetical protein
MRKLAPSSSKTSSLPPRPEQAFHTPNSRASASSSLQATHGRRSSQTLPPSQRLEQRPRNKSLLINARHTSLSEPTLNLKGSSSQTPAPQPSSKQPTLFPKPEFFLPPRPAGPESPITPLIKQSLEYHFPTQRSSQPQRSSARQSEQHGQHASRKSNLLSPETKGGGGGVKFHSEFLLYCHT